MTELPERIWACMGGPMVGMFVSGGNNGGWPEYVRADAIEALTAERDRLAAAVDAVMADRARIIGERDRLRLYAGHDDDCTINRYPATGACSCGLRAALPAVQRDPVPYGRRSPMEHERDLGDEG